MKVVTKGRCPTCLGSGEVSSTSESGLMGTAIVEYAHSILREEAFKYGVAVGDIAGPTRIPHVVEARGSVAVRCREELGMTLESVGTLLGGRDHSTVIYMLRRARGESTATAHKRRVA